MNFMKENLPLSPQDRQTAEAACDTVLKKLAEIGTPLKVGSVDAVGEVITQERLQQLREEIIQAGMEALAIVDYLPKSHLTLPL